MNRDNYPVVVFWSDADECWIADVPDLEYCTAHGDTADEAVREVLIAREAWLEVAREHGHELPDPLRSPFLPEIAREVLTDHAKLAAAAATSGTGMGAEGGAAK